ncbi:hypothetical protein ACFXKI_52630 [Streptomyces mirabilis]|uniref:hypothetical protein n=1 Tax=Streptomyces mirabilis TaxID=68239 RepID=UPI0036A470F8
MRRTLTIATAAVLLAGLAACSNSKTGTTTADKPTTLSKPATVSKPVNASTAFMKLSAMVDSARLSGTVTAANDPNRSCQLGGVRSVLGLTGRMEPSAGAAVRVPQVRL